MTDDVEIRPIRDGDASGRVALMRLLEPDAVVTVAGFRHSLATAPERGRQLLWTAEAGGEVVGTAGARLAWDSGRDDLGQLWVGVRPDHRRRGVGSQLHGLAERHLRALGAAKVETWIVDNEDGMRFLERHGFERTRTAQLWTLDPRAVDTSGLPELERTLSEQGFRVATLREVRDRERELHALYAEAIADQPADEPETRVEFELWQRRALRHPDVSPDGSFVALNGERPVSLAWLAVDGDGRATNWLTGTARDHRRRGLARLVKLATIRWAVANGITAISTGNDSTNADMLALNAHLGYRPTATGSTYAKAL